MLNVQVLFPGRLLIIASANMVKVTGTECRESTLPFSLHNFLKL
jgi:hypothetical protein